MKQIPNLFTLLNLFLGCVAIVFALQTEAITVTVQQDFTTSISIPEKLALASLLLYAAAVVDFLDGFVARLFNATSEMGKQLDSLADVVSFGVAPGVIIYQLLRMSYLREDASLEMPLLALLPAFILSCAAAYRLAKFNLDSSQKYSFKGVPTPAVGLFVASFPLIIFFGENIADVNSWLSNKWVLYALILILSWLMVSNLPLMAFKFKNLSVKNNLPQFLLVFIAIVSIIFLKWLAVPLIFIAYIILSLAFKNKTTP